MRLIFAALLALMLSACASTADHLAHQETTNAYASNQDHSADTPIHRAAKKSSGDKTIDLDNGSVDALATPGDSDLWSRIRRGFQLTDLSSDLVDTQTQWYASRPDYVQRMTDRSRLYLYHIVEQLEERHMPTELALLPFIESAYNPQALSVAKAAGMWQFVPTTGKDYNLKQNMFQDERRDVLASTDAALDYLSRLHDMFGDWYLALAAYNWGEGNVQRAIARNAAQGLPTDYMSLRMPNETRNYVPKLQAVKNLIENPAQYGLTLPSIPNHPYFVTVTTKRDIDVKVAAKLADLSLDDFKALNPSFTKPVILGATQPQILLPFDSAETFAHNLKSYTLPLSSWTTYQVSSRERTADVAAKIGVSAETLMAVNKIPAGMRLKAGSTLLVPKGDDDGNVNISASVAENAVLSIEPDRPDVRRVLVRLPRRESAVAVASRYGVSAASLHRWNRTRAATFNAGTRLVVYVPSTNTDESPRVNLLETVPVAADNSSQTVRQIRAADDARRAASRPVVETRKSPSRAASRAEPKRETRQIARREVTRSTARPASPAVAKEASRAKPQQAAAPVTRTARATPPVRSTRTAAAARAPERKKQVARAQEETKKPIRRVSTAATH